MRRLVLALVLATVAVPTLAAPALAAVDDQPTEKPEPQGPPATHEYLSERPSGFWTSNRPAMGGAYRYRLLIVGLIVAAGTGFLIYRVITKANRQSVRR
jgi:hypothetical protein